MRFLVINLLWYTVLVSGVSTWMGYQFGHEDADNYWKTAPQERELLAQCMLQLGNTTSVLLKTGLNK